MNIFHTALNARISLGGFCQNAAEGEACILANIIRDMDSRLAIHPPSSYDHYLLILARRKLSQTGVHIRGVEVLTPGNETLHFHDTGLIRDLCTNEQGLTLKQKQTWIEAFKLLVKFLGYVWHY